MTKHRINLGDRVKDKVSGFEGTVVARTEWLNGCWRMVVAPRVDKDGKMGDTHSFDEPQLELVIEKAAKQGSKKTGGPESIKPTQHSTPKRI